ncbi:hypothetical protein EDD85DRAFT_796610 [Armillaria nabsnona]|nr:hypothetical protein EDD85DRAFT_796610 [Armillaria nabsnona]
MSCLLPSPNSVAQTLQSMDPQRACWSDWNAASNALYKATYTVHTIKRGEISTMCPVFFTEVDLSAQNGQLIWGKTTWISGQRNISPDKVLVVGGHSAGGQMAQHYEILRPSTDEDDRCEGVDAFKYRLESNFPEFAGKNARALGREGIIKRYHNQTLNYAWGLTDTFIVDSRTKSFRRGRNFVAMLEDIGDIPKLTTVDWGAWRVDKEGVYLFELVTMTEEDHSCSSTEVELSVKP